MTDQPTSNQITPASEPSTDPALRAHTFMDNEVLRESLQRLAARYQANTLGTLEVVVSEQTTEADEPEFDAAESPAMPLPSEMDISIQYLLVHDWKMIDGVPHCMFIDPTNEDAVLYLEACERQAMRDTRDFMDETARERELNDAAMAEDVSAGTRFGPLTPPDDYRIFNRPQADGSYRPLSEFFKID